MTNLDDPHVYTELDPSNMLGRIGELSRQCDQAWQSAIAFSLPSDYRNVNKVVVLGMGGSAIGGDMLRSLALSEGRIPVLVHRDYCLPPLVDGATLVIASSYSGNTEETLSAFSQALKTPAKKLAITTGGRLRTIANESGLPVFTFDYKSEPRAAFGYSFFSLLAILHRLGIIAIKPEDVTESIDVLNSLSARFGRDTPRVSNPAKQLASRLAGRLVMIYGAGILSEVAFRWKTQFNENSKSCAVCECLPELNHNAVVGYRFPIWLAERGYVIMLRAPSLHPRVVVRYDITADLLRNAAINHEIVDASGHSLLAQMMSVITFGDHVSYYLALLNGIDPSPVAAIDYLKRRLAEAPP